MKKTYKPVVNEGWKEGGRGVKEGVRKGKTLSKEVKSRVKKERMLRECRERKILLGK